MEVLRTIAVFVGTLAAIEGGILLNMLLIWLIKEIIKNGK